MKPAAVASVRSPRQKLVISFELASSAARVHTSPPPAAFVSGVVFFSFAPTDD
jgi:hypothetical protein